MHDAITDFSTEILQVKREWQDTFQVMKQKKLQWTIFYPAKLFLTVDGEIKSFPDQEKLREFSTIKPALQQQFL